MSSCIWRNSSGPYGEKSVTGFTFGTLWHHVFAEVESLWEYFDSCVPTPARFSALFRGWVCKEEHRMPLYLWMESRAILVSPAVAHRHEADTPVYPTSSLQYLNRTSWQNLNLKVNSGWDQISKVLRPDGKVCRKTPAHSWPSCLLSVSLVLGRLVWFGFVSKQGFSVLLWLSRNSWKSVSAFQTTSGILLLFLFSLLF